jgi:hypothetical protein
MWQNRAYRAPGTRFAFSFRRAYLFPDRFNLWPALFQLTALEDPSSAEVEAIELLTLLVERYEQAHYAIPEADAVSVVRLLVEQQGLTQRDLTPQFPAPATGSYATATHPKWIGRPEWPG